VWENLLEGRVKPAEWLDLAIRALPRETDEQNTQRILSYLTRTFWHQIPAGQREARAPELESFLRSGLTKAPTAVRNRLGSTPFVTWCQRATGSRF